MGDLEHLLDPARIGYILLGVLLLEMLGLMALWRASGKGLPPAQTITFLGAGASLAAVLLLATAGASAAWIALALMAALGLHLSDIWLRWRH